MIPAIIFFLIIISRKNGIISLFNIISFLGRCFEVDVNWDLTFFFFFFFASSLIFFFFYYLLR